MAACGDMRRSTSRFSSWISNPTTASLTVSLATAQAIVCSIAIC